MARRRDAGPAPDVGREADALRVLARYTARLHVRWETATPAEIMEMDDGELRELVDDMSEAHTVLRCLDRAEARDPRSLPVHRRDRLH